MRALVVGTEAAARWGLRWWVGGLALAGLALVAQSSSAKVDRFPRNRPGRLWTWEELTVSPTARRLGLDNTPGPVAQANLRRLCAEVLDPLRARWPGIRVNSAFRTLAVNRAVGGVANSRHLQGLAADLAFPPRLQRTAVDWLRRRGIRPVEYAGHVHVALTSRKSAVSRGRSV